MNSNITKVHDLKGLAVLKESSPETISEESFLRARANVSSMQLLTTEDAFLFYSSLNLLNTYVKQNKNKIKYGFKKHVTDAFDSAIVNQVGGISYSYDDREKLLIVNVADLQFSFHNVVPSAKMNFVRMSPDKDVRSYYHKEDWEGFRLQPIGETLFKYANNLSGLTKECLYGDLKEFQDECVKEAKQKAEEIAQINESSQME